MDNLEHINGSAVRRRGGRGVRALTDEQVRQVKAELAAPGAIAAHVAKKWGVSKGVIVRIKAGVYPGGYKTTRSTRGDGRPRGSSVPMFSAEQVDQIRADLAAGASQTRVATKWGVSQTLIWTIASGRYDRRKRVTVPPVEKPAAVAPAPAPASAFLDELSHFLRAITNLVEWERRKYD